MITRRSTAASRGNDSGKGKESSSTTPLSPQPRGQQRRSTRNANWSGFVFLISSILVLSIILYVWKVTRKDFSTSDTINATSSQDTTEYHMVFSTDCNLYHDWQSFVFFYYAQKVGQPGTITRIASGCLPEQAKRLQSHHDKYVAPLSSKSLFRLHLTPDFKGEQNYPFFNKPFGLRHWMEHVLGYGTNTNQQNVNDNAIITLMDPDMILFKPFTSHFRPMDRWKEVEDYENRNQVDHGYPVAQQYLLDDIWRAWNLTDIVGPDSPALQVTHKQAMDHYQVGPPYMATARDMYRIAVRWTDIVPTVWKIYPKLLAEMYGYSIAAADLKLPHQLSNSFMVSDPRVQRYTEEWKGIEQLDNAQLCEDPKRVDNLPYAMHYCQPCSIGEWFVYKAQIKHIVIPMHCERPLLAEPPNDMGLHYNMSLRHPIAFARTPKQDTPLARELFNKKQMFMVCQAIKKWNEAFEHFKHLGCSGETTNFDETFRMIKQNDSLK